MRLAFVCLCAWLAAVVWISQPSGKPITQRVVAPLLRPDEGPAHEALDEVNVARAKRHLPPFVRDDGLTTGAKAIAAYRAEHRITGHHHDFDFLPQGVTAKAAGCGVSSSGEGWNTCCTYERWTYAGAAWAMGLDGKRYCHIFVK